MDIATLLESHRRYLLEVAADYVSDADKTKTIFAMEVAHDRATTRTLLDLYRSGVPANGAQPVGQAALITPIPTPSRRVKAGSKAARQRAIKAGETRRKNLALKQADAEKHAQESRENPAGQPFVQTVEGGGQ